jgi:hypothetical protein
VSSLTLYLHVFCCKLISNTFPCFMLDRLDKKYPPYELIWQDSQQLAGKVLLDNLLEIHLIFRMLLYCLLTLSAGKLCSHSIFPDLWMLTTRSWNNGICHLLRFLYGAVVIGLRGTQRSPNQWGTSPAKIHSLVIVKGR